MYDFKMVKKTANTTTVKEFNGHEIHTTKSDKTGNLLAERWEHLWKYSLTKSGYKHQLELMGFVLIR